MRTAPVLGLILAAATLLRAVEPVPRGVTPQRIDGAKVRNVVFILSDDHRYDAMSFLGHQFARTPHMDSLVVDEPINRNAR